MADKWVDPNATGNNDGSSPANAWTSLRAALGSGNLQPGDVVWVRRTLNENVSVTSGMSMGYFGTRELPIKIIGWPRPEISGTATFTQNSRYVTNLSITEDERAHTGRRIKCNSDGRWYTIGRVDTTNHRFILVERYVGSSVSGADFTIAADDDYDARPQAGRDAGWDSDSQQMPAVYSSVASPLLTLARSNVHFKCIHFSITGGSGRVLQISYTTPDTQSNRGWNAFTGCVFKTAGGTGTYTIYTGDGYGNSWPVRLVRCSILRTVTVSSSYGIYMAGGQIQMEHCYLEGGSWGIGTSTNSYFNGLYCFNCHFGTFVTKSLNIQQSFGAFIIGEKVNLDEVSSTGTDFLYASGMGPLHPLMLGWAGSSGSINTHILGGQWNEAIYSAYLTTNPYPRTGGGNPVLQVDRDNARQGPGRPDLYRLPAAEFRIWCAANTARTFRIYMHNTGTAIPAGDIELEATYIDQYYSSSLFHVEVVSTSRAVAQAQSSSDWSQYQEIGPITPAVDGWVTLRLFLSIKNTGAYTYLYVDPKVEVS